MTQVKKKPAPPAQPPKILFDEPEARLVNFTMKPGREGEGPRIRLLFEMPATSHSGNMLSALRRLNKESCVLRVIMPQLQIPEKKVPNTAPTGSDRGTMFQGDGEDVEEDELPE